MSNSVLIIKNPFAFVMTGAGTYRQRTPPTTFMLSYPYRKSLDCSVNLSFPEQRNCHTIVSAEAAVTGVWTRSGERYFIVNEAVGTGTYLANNFAVYELPVARTKQPIRQPYCQQESNINDCPEQNTIHEGMRM